MAVCGQVVGRELPVQLVAIGEPVPGVVEVAQSLIWGFETFDPFVDMGELTRIYGVELTPFEIVADPMFGAAGR